ncbi:MAG: hypothetical protein GXO45_01125, partial [Aquificae bacterium]|nr:hypothetical protein [Aquificota bacterium]
ITLMCGRYVVKHGSSVDCDKLANEGFNDADPDILQLYKGLELSKFCKRGCEFIKANPDKYDLLKEKLIKVIKDAGCEPNMKAINKIDQL